MKSSVCKLAAHFIKQNKFSRSEAMKLAWKVVKLKKAMRENEFVHFTFVKTDLKTVREAVGTLHQNIIPMPKGTGRPSPINIVRYYDLEKNGWRSFRAELLAA